MKRLKGVFGILMIAVALCGIFAWESFGRDRVLNEDVLVAIGQISEGEEISVEMLCVKSVNSENLIDGAFKEKDLKKVIGRTLRQDVAKNSQISEIFLHSDELLLRKKETIFPIKNQWIDSISSSLRRGDKISLYTKDANEKIGEFVVAFVKDAQDKEIKSDGKGAEKRILERINGEGIIRYIEIIATLSQYKEILEFVENGSKLLIIQEI